MAGDKLQITVEADTSSAQKGIQGLADDLKDVGKAAEGASQDAAKSTDTLGEALKRAAAAGLPGFEKAAKAVDNVGVATLTASKSTAVFETAFQKLGRNISSFGRNAMAGLKGFGSMVASGLGIGTGVAIATKAFDVLVAVAMRAFREIAEAGKRLGQALGKAFGAGVSLGRFRELEGLGQALGMSGEGAERFAAGVRSIAEAARSGNTEWKQLSAIAKALGADIKDLASQDPSRIAKFITDIAPALQKMDDLQATNVLEKFFPKNSDEDLAKILQMARDGKTTLEDLTTATGKYAEAAKAADEWNRKTAEGFGKLTSGLGSILTALPGVQASMWAWKTTIEALPGLMAAVGDKFQWLGDKLKTIGDAFAISLKIMFGPLLDTVNEVTGKALAAFVKFATDVKDALGTGLVAAAEGNKQAIIAAWAQITEAITGLWDGLLTSITGILDSITAEIKSWADSIVAIVNKAAGAFKSIGSWLPGMGGDEKVQGQRRPMPMAPQGMPGLRAFSLGAPQARAMGLIGPRATAAGGSADTIGSAAWSKNLDTLIFKYDEVAKAAKKAGEAGKQAGTDQATGALTAAQAWDQLPTSQKIAIENFKTMMEQADEMNAQFASFGEAAVFSFLDAAMAGEDLRDVLAGLLKDLAKMLLQMYVLKPLFGSMFPTGGAGLWSAGPASAGMPVAANANMLMAAPASAVSGLSNIAGRRSLSTTATTPGNAGVTTNLNGDINIDMSKSGLVTASSEDAKKLGMQIEKAVSVVLVRESRPGGLLRQGAA